MDNQKKVERLIIQILHRQEIDIISELTVSLDDHIDVKFASLFNFITECDRVNGLHKLLEVM